MDIEDFERLVEILRAAGAREVDLLGGEPTLHPEFIRMLDVIREKGMRCSISTNGSNPALLEECAERHPNGTIKIGISINTDAVSPELREFIYKQRPMLKSVSARKGTVSEAAKEYLGSPGIEYYLIYRDAVAVGDLEETLPFPEYMNHLDTLKSRFRNIEGVHCGFLPDGKNPALTRVRCPAGTTKLSVLPDGSAYPCYLFFRHEEFRLGNVLNDGFDRIWENPVLDYFREFLGNRCPSAGCPLFSSCRGGCPAIGLLLGNGIESPDPRCIGLPGSVCTQASRDGGATDLSEKGKLNL